MESAGTIRRIGAKARDEDSSIIITPSEYNEDYGEAKLTKQVRWIKQNLGLGSMLSLLAILIALGVPAFKQGEANATYATAINGLTKSQDVMREDLQRQIAEGQVRIETQVNRLVDGQKDQQAEIRDLRQSMEHRIGLVEQKADSVWNWQVELKNRVGMLEAERKKQESR